MPSLKASRGSKDDCRKLAVSSSTGTSIHVIANLDDDLPLVQRRRRQVSPLALPCVAVGAGICLTALVATVTYLVVSNCRLQAQVTAAQEQTASTKERLDRLVREHLELHSQDRRHKKTSRDGRDSKVPMNTRADSKQNYSLDLTIETKAHTVRKRDVSKTEIKSERSKQNSDRSVSDTSERSRLRRSKRENRQINKRLGYLSENMQTLRRNYRRDLNNLAHPSARMVLPPTPDIDEFTDQLPSSGKDNVITWKAEHNALFETDDSAHFTVKTPGAYFVYLQVTYNGQERRVNPTCSHIVMSENSKHNRTRLLLYGSTTQYNLGGLIRLSATGEEIKATDSVHVSGVFHLMSGDRLYVRPDDFSRLCVVSNFRDQTFFGAFRLQSSSHDSDLL